MTNGFKLSKKIIFYVVGVLVLLLLLFSMGFFANNVLEQFDQVNSTSNPIYSSVNPGSNVKVAIPSTTTLSNTTLYLATIPSIARPSAATLSAATPSLATASIATTPSAYETPSAYATPSVYSTLLD